MSEDEMSIDGGTIDHVVIVFRPEGARTLVAHTTLVLDHRKYSPIY